MEYALPDDIKTLRREIRAFVEKEIAPIARAIDEEERVPFEVLKKAGELGFIGIPFPEAYGGIDAGIVGYSCIAFLLRYLQRASTLAFTIYRVVFGLLILVLLVVR